MMGAQICAYFSTIHAVWVSLRDSSSCQIRVYICFIMASSWASRPAYLSLDRWSADDDGFVSLSSLLSSSVDAHHCGVGWLYAPAESPIEVLPFIPRFVIVLIYFRESICLIWSGPGLRSLPYIFGCDSINSSDVVVS